MDMGLVHSLFYREFKVYKLFQALDTDVLETPGTYVPFLFMEWDNSVLSCPQLAATLRALGYRGYVKMWMWANICQQSVKPMPTS